MKVSIFTPTNGRPDLLELCKLYVERQTYPIHEHLIESGGTLAENLRSGLPKLTGDVVVIFEDDDHYHPQWVEWCVKHLEDYDVVGEAATRYYHLPTRGYAVLGTGPQRSSLCNTALRHRMIPLLLSEVREDLVGIDLHFWKRAVEHGVAVHTNIGPQTDCDRPPCRKQECGLVTAIDPPLYVTGMKGIARGMSFGHQPAYYSGFHHDDVEYSMLRHWVGDEDIEHYLALA